MDFDVIIGIETHIQLNTQSKMFCTCSAGNWQAQPNTATCPTCLGLPGALPVPNKEAIDKAILMGLALNSHIATQAKFDRKNYFYPDLAKAYQISQYDQPLASGGQVDVDGQTVELVRAHLEEDVGKLSHQGNYSLVDFNKGGTPLLEIVSKPVMHSAAQAKAYVQKLRQIARYIGVNDGNLERGTMRADVNISLQAKGSWRQQGDGLIAITDQPLNSRVEVKNLNSFRAIERAVEYEIKRQHQALQDGQTIIQETRGWDEAKGRTTSQRGKEEAHDYRYFPEPDIPPLVIDQAWVDDIKSRLPELADAKMTRFMTDYDLSDYDARLLVEEKITADWYEQAVAQYAQSSRAMLPETAKTVANWMLGELARLANDSQTPLVDSQLTPASLADLLQRLKNQDLSAASAKQVLEKMYTSGQTAQAIIESEGLQQLSGQDTLMPIVEQILADNQDAVDNIKNGKVSAAQFLVGQVMKQTRGQAKPDEVRAIIAQKLGIDLE